MYLKKKHNAFTLAEVMIVLLVLTILFAAFAPFITRRSKTAGKTDLWRWSSRNYLEGPMDAYYVPDDDKGGIYFGTMPEAEDDINFAPLSKVVIRSGYIADNLIQRQLQLRYGRDDFEDPGQFAGTFIADGHNMLFGGDFSKLKHHSSNLKYPMGNVSFGFGALNEIQETNSNDEEDFMRNNTAFGYYALNKTTNGSDNTAVGAGAGLKNITGSKNTLIGYMAGAQAEVPDGNTLIGYSSNGGQGEYNTFVGAATGNNTVTGSGSGNYNYNVALGYKALSNIVEGSYNVAIGSGALQNLTTGSYNTAIGYNACANIKGQSRKTCIGANSGPAKGSQALADLGHSIDDKDSTQITYIGSNPNMVTDIDNEKYGEAKTSKYGGDAVLEIYNMSGTPNDSLINDPVIKSNTTTVINGNLIVKGKTYLTVGNILYPFYYSNNIFGTKISDTTAGTSGDECALNQWTYVFDVSGRCSELSAISSDRRLKNISSRNNDGLDKIKQLKIYNYTFKDDKQQKKHVGVIAQELQKIFPNSVFKDENGYLKIRWDEMFYASINAIKELNIKTVNLIKQNLSFDKKITKLEKRNADLQKQVNTLSNRVEALKKQKETN